MALATKPSVRIPEWASGGTSTDPGAGKEASGWLVAERPPANWWNWLLNSLGQWAKYFASKHDEMGVRATITHTAGAAKGTLNADAFGILDVDRNGDDLEITLDPSIFASSDIQVFVQPMGSLAAYHYSVAVNSNSFLILNTFDPDGTTRSLAANNTEVSIMCFGERA